MHDEGDRQNFEERSDRNLRHGKSRRKNGLQIGLKLLNSEVEKKGAGLDQLIICVVIQSQYLHESIATFYVNNCAPQLRQ